LDASLTLCMRQTHGEVDLTYSNKEFEALWKALTDPDEIGDSDHRIDAWWPPDSVEEKESIGEALRALSLSLADRDWPGTVREGLKSELLERTAAAGLGPVALIPLAGSKDDTVARLLLDMVDVCAAAWAEGVKADVGDWTMAKEGLVLAAMALENGPLVTRWEAGESVAPEVWDEALAALGHGMAQILRLRDLLGCTQLVFGIGNGLTFWRRCIATLFEVMSHGSDSTERGDGDEPAA
jgi:hypothetical protein